MGRERGPSREARLTHLLLTPRPHRSLLPAVFSRLFIHWIKLRRDLAGKKISSLPLAPAKKQVLLPALLPGPARAAPATGCEPSRGRCIPQQGGGSANLLLALARLQSHAGTTSPSLPPRSRRAARFLTAAASKGGPGLGRGCR